MAKAPAIASLVAQTDVAVYYELSIVDPDQQLVGKVELPVDGSEEGIRVHGGPRAERAARQLVGRILAIRLRGGAWPDHVQQVS